MSLTTKTKKAEGLGIDLSKIDGEITEEKLDELIEAKLAQNEQNKQEAKIKKDAEKKAADEAKRTELVLKDVDGFDVDQADYFFPREEDQTVNGKVLKATDQTAPATFNKVCGYPVEREELVDAFSQIFPKRKGFLFYRQRDREVYLVIVPRKYAKTISRANESQPGDFQKHAVSFINEGSVNVDSLKRKLTLIANHSSISTEPLD